MTKENPELGKSERVNRDWVQNGRYQVDYAEYLKYPNATELSDRDIHRLAIGEVDIDDAEETMKLIELLEASSHDDSVERLEMIWDRLDTMAARHHAQKGDAETAQFLLSKAIWYNS